MGTREHRIGCPRKSEMTDSQLDRRKVDLYFPFWYLNCRMEKVK